MYKCIYSNIYVFYVQIWLCKSFPTYVNDMFNILWYINTYICMLNAFVHVCVMNNILMIIITLHSIEKSSNITHPYTNALSTHIYMYVKYKIWQYKSFYTYIIGIFNVMLYIKYMYMYVICSCTCVCDEQYFNDINNTTQHWKKFKQHLSNIP